MGSPTGRRIHVPAGETNFFHRGTDGSNPLSSSVESGANLTFCGCEDARHQGAARICTPRSGAKLGMLPAADGNRVALFR
jgi:hypothetical protein